MNKLLRASVLISLLIFCWSLGLAERNRTLGKILDLKGSIQIQQKEKSVTPKVGLKIKEKNKLTTGKGSRCLIELNGLNAKIQIGPNSIIQFHKKGIRTQDHQFKVHQGLVWIKKNPGDYVLKAKTHLSQLKTLNSESFVRVGPGDEEAYAVKKGRLEIQGVTGRVVLGPQAQAKLFSGVPPIIIGMTQTDLLDWGEPYEEID